MGILLGGLEVSMTRVPDKSCVGLPSKQRDDLKVHDILPTRKKEILEGRPKGRAWKRDSRAKVTAIPTRSRRDSVRASSADEGSK